MMMPRSRVPLLLACAACAAGFAPTAPARPATPARRHVHVACRGYPGSHERARRSQRVGTLVQQELATVLSRGDTRGSRQIEGGLRHRISIIDVDVSPDLGQANVKVSVIGDRKDKITATRWLQSNARHIRHELAQRLREMRRVPTLRFVHVDVGAAVDVMVTLDRLRAEREGRSATTGGDLDLSGDGGDDDLDFDVSDEDAFDSVDDLTYDSELYEDGSTDDLFIHTEE